MPARSRHCDVDSTQLEAASNDTDLIDETPPVTTPPVATCRAERCDFDRTWCRIAHARDFDGVHLHRNGAHDLGLGAVTAARQLKIWGVVISIERCGKLQQDAKAAVIPALYHAAVHDGV